MPQACILCILNADVLKAEITKGYTEACGYYGIQAIGVRNIDMINGHPTVKGMAQIKDQILENL